MKWIHVENSEDLPNKSGIYWVLLQPDIREPHVSICMFENYEHDKPEFIDFHGDDRIHSVIAYAPCKFPPPPKQINEMAAIHGMLSESCQHGMTAQVVWTFAQRWDGRNDTLEQEINDAFDEWDI